jgi:hypothetical protein
MRVRLGTVANVSLSTKPALDRLLRDLRVAKG